MNKTGKHCAGCCNLITPMDKLICNIVGGCQGAVIAATQKQGDVETIDFDTMLLGTLKHSMQLMCVTSNSSEHAERISRLNADISELALTRLRCLARTQTFIK